MIGVLASRYDELARELVSQWEAQGAALLTCGDLSTAGWCHYVGSPGLSTAVIAGRRVAAGEITGVLTRMAFLAEQELVDIVPSDRAYAASEMTAFLLSWLSNLTCPVLNPPTPTSLCGPYWRSEQWNSIAKTAGMRVHPATRRVSLGAQPMPPVPPSLAMVTIVGTQCLGDADEKLVQQAKALARIAGVDFLSVQFSSPGPDAFFVRASVCPEAITPEVAEALFAHLVHL